MPVAEAEQVSTVDDIDARSIREDDETRRHRIMADPYMDAELKLQLLDETPLTTEDLAELYGRTVHTIWNWRKPLMEERRPRPHPRMLPVDPEPIGFVAGRATPGVAAGRAREWGAEAGVIFWRRSRKRFEHAPYKASGGPKRRKRVRSDAQ